MLPSRIISGTVVQLIKQEYERLEREFPSVVLIPYEEWARKELTNPWWLHLATVAYLDSMVWYLCPHCRGTYQGVEKCPTCKVCDDCGELLVDGECPSWKGATRQ